MEDLLTFPRCSNRLLRLAVGYGLLLVLAVIVTAPCSGQNWRWRSRVPPRFRDAEAPRDGRFSFCRVLYRSVRDEPLGHGWNTDYPEADVNFMNRLEEFTNAAVSRDGQGRPNHYVVTLADDAIFDCPFVFMSDVGTAGFSDDEADRLRRYLLRGGFLYVDDFWGRRAWEHWSAQMARVLPPGQYPIVDLAPDHPIFHVHYDVAEVPQIPSIQFWRRTGGYDTSERGEDSRYPHLRGIEAEDGRLMVVMSHNTDIADGWEREGEEYEFFQRFSAVAYAVGMNILLYAMTH